MLLRFMGLPLQYLHLAKNGSPGMGIIHLAESGQREMSSQLLLYLVLNFDIFLYIWNKEENKLLKGILWPIFCTDKNAHSDRKWKILKTYFFKMFLLLLIFFLDTIISVILSTQIACYIMCVQYVQKQPLEAFFKKDVLKNFANFAEEYLCWSLFFNKVTGLRACSFIKKRPQHRCVPVKLAKFYDHLFWRTAADHCWSNDM